MNLQFLGYECEEFSVTPITIDTESKTFEFLVSIALIFLFSPGSAVRVNVHVVEITVAIVCVDFPYAGANVANR